MRRYTLLTLLYLRALHRTALHCTANSLVKSNREIGSQQIRLYREKSSETPVPPELQGQGPFCRRCRIHGEWKRWNGHKKQCPFASCTCARGCCLVKDRKSNESALRAEVQRARERPGVVPPTLGAAPTLPSLPLGAHALASPHLLHAAAASTAASAQKLLSTALFASLPKSSPTGSCDAANNNINSSKGGSIAALPQQQQPQVPRSHTVLNLIGASASPSGKQEASVSCSASQSFFELMPMRPLYPQLPLQSHLNLKPPAAPAGNFMFPSSPLPLLPSADGFAFNFANAQSSPSAAAFYYPPFHLSSGAPCASTCFSENSHRRAVGAIRSPSGPICFALLICAHIPTLNF